MIVGFVDDAGEHVSFDEVRRGEGSFSIPLPFLRALADGYRSADHYGSTNVVSVTTLIAPIQQARLVERHSIYVDPLSSMWAVFGTLGHKILEGHVLERLEDAESMIAERRLVVRRDGVLVGGTFDLLRRAEDSAWVGCDYKVTSAYSVAKMKLEGVAKGKPDYSIQANCYRAMIADSNAREVVDRTLRPFEYAGLDVGGWELVCWVRDFHADRGSDEMTVSVGSSQGRRDVKINPIEVLPVKLGPIERIEAWLRERLAVYAASALCDDDGLPECSVVERWGGRRCRAWCSAASHCHQYQGGKR